MKIPTTPHPQAMEDPSDEGHVPASSAQAVSRRRGVYNPSDSPLSTRELEVLSLIFQELTNVEIGDRLCLSPRTVETYRRTMMEKVNARNTVGLVLYALRRGLISLEPHAT